MVTGWNHPPLLVQKKKLSGPPSSWRSRGVDGLAQPLSSEPCLLLPEVHGKSIQEVLHLGASENSWTDENWQLSSISGKASWIGSSVYDIYNWYIFCFWITLDSYDYICCFYGAFSQLMESTNQLFRQRIQVRVFLWIPIGFPQVPVVLIATPCKKLGGGTSEALVKVSKMDSWLPAGSTEHQKLGVKKSGLLWGNGW